MKEGTAMAEGQILRFDAEEGRRMVDSFFHTSGIPCRLFSETGAVLHIRGEDRSGCALCRRAGELTGRPPRCERLHLHGAAQAERFGGRYIYYCPFDMAWFTSPIMVEGSMAGALVAGPVLITDAGEYLEDLFVRHRLPQTLRRELEAGISRLVQTEPSRLNHLSGQLFASALCISDSSHELFVARRDSRRQDVIGEYIQMLKTDGEKDPYPLNKERELCRAVELGDKGTASRLLNEILGHLFFSAGSTEELRSRVTELLVLMSRSAIRDNFGGERILAFNHRCLEELRRINDQSALAPWLAGVLNRFIDLVFTVEDSRHGNSIYRALEYMDANYARKLSLAEVAQQAGYSPAYFSRVFREERGCTFREHLNELRIEKSKALLLGGSHTIAEICALVGFEDQSYFGRVFRRHTGTTPDRYRKRARRIDSRREHGS